MPSLLSINTYNYRRGGSDVVFLEHDAMFADIGWRTASMAMHHPKNYPSKWDKYFVREIEFGNSYGVFQKALMAGKVIYSLEAKNKVSKLLDDFSADVAHAHCIYHHLSPSVLVELKRRNIPVVMTAHDLKLACPSYKMVNRLGICERCKNGNFLHTIKHRCVRGSLAVSALVALESTVHRKFGLYKDNLDMVVAPSIFMRNKLIEWGWSGDQIRHIPNYVHVDSYEPRFQPGSYFVYFGRLQLDKGVATVIRAASKANVPLQIVGTGPDEEALKTIAEESKGSVIFHGYQQGESLRTLVGNSRAVVLASEIYENAPMSVLEGYAMGKPAIGARIGGIPELIKDTETGLLFESGDVDELADCLAYFSALNNRRVEEMGRQCRDFVTANFCSDIYMSRMLGLYSDLGVRV